MDPDIEPVILANSKFSIDLLKVLCQGNTDNVLFSPLSISSALGLVLLGAGGDTADQMYKALHFGKMRIMYHYLYEELYKEGEYKYVDGDHKKRSLQLVNRLFGDKTVNFYDDFLDYCEEWCFASLRSVDFKTDPDATREKINSWVEKKICDQMKDLLDQGDVSKDTSLALISAVHFKKNWVKNFASIVPKKNCSLPGVSRSARCHLGFQTDRLRVTLEGPAAHPLVPLFKEFIFQNLTDKEVDWPMMGKKDTLPLGTIPHRQHQRPAEARILEIPYENNHLSMLIILPNNSEDLPKLVDSITYEKILEWTKPDNMIPTKVTVEMPIFTLEEKYDLEKDLNALGINDLFSENCDLSGMASGPLKLSKVVHKSVVEVDKEGTDAGGGGGGVCFLICYSNEIPESFIADHPFLFFIRHNPTKSIIFWGRVISP